ncbi:hypothetical protein [Nonomuraea sp. NPDC050540]|uniref:hypothetical protein n=1 Tax=Nonomuraea sp. NPDC050540 TaxID=3364367 RepID=UPI003795A5EC
MVWRVAGADWSWAQTAVLIAATIAILGTTMTAALTYALSQRAARRERQAKVFADALSVIEEYAELPYRVRRRRSLEEARHALTEEISRVQSRMAFHQGWLQIEAPSVASFYDQLIRAAKKQAGLQMKEAWLLPPITEDSGVNLGAAYNRTEIDNAREMCVAAMRLALASIPRERAAVDRASPGQDLL